MDYEISDEELQYVLSFIEKERPGLLRTMQVAFQIDVASKETEDAISEIGKAIDKLPDLIDLEDEHESLEKFGILMSSVLYHLRTS